MAEVWTYHPSLLLTYPYLLPEGKLIVIASVKDSPERELYEAIGQEYYVRELIQGTDLLRYDVKPLAQPEPDTAPVTESRKKK